MQTSPDMVPTQVDFSGDSPVNQALTAVAQEVAGLLQQAYPVQADGINHPRTIATHAVEPEYRQIITTEPLTERELAVLQLVVDGYSNSAIAQRLYIAVGTVRPMSAIFCRNFVPRTGLRQQSGHSAPVLSTREE